ncbi:DUF4382 domain-containing protein [Proteobacteria bacterium 005FR1]|nr:DUF4382 domain-containing protein [Proteobacteria bacterium 005FR1]
MQRTSARRYWPVLLAAGLVGGCDDVEPEDQVPPRVIGSAEAGRLDLALSESALVGADRVTLTVNAVQLRRSDGEILEFPLSPPITSVFPDFGSSTIPSTQQPTVLLDDQSIPAGAYDWLRLVFDDTRLFVEVDGRQLPLRLEESLDSALLDFDVIIADDTELDLTIVLDLRRSLFEVFNQFVFRPSLRIIQTDLSGTLLGTVDNRLLDVHDCAGALAGGSAIYVFAGVNAPIQDIRDDLFDPFATAEVTGFDTGLSQFRVDFLPPGDFTVVFTCDALLDDPALDDSLRVDFSSGFEARIEAGQSTRITIH